VWINELHYDNTSSDTNEGVEIAGVAGTDLSNYRLVFYEGNDGGVDDEEALMGIVDDERLGFGAVWFPVKGIEQGPDGVALVDVSGGTQTLLQFVSYEGAFMAAGGVADGTVSTDIGIQEGSSTPIGFSLQLRGRGSTYKDFTWVGPTNHSRGSLNSGQTAVPVGSFFLVK
jgi:hypothetical protein